MKLFLKIIKLFTALLFTVLIILLSASFLLKDKVGIIILKSFNRNLSTKLDVGSYRLSFLNKFPKASLELKDVLVHSSPDFDRNAFQGSNTDTLLTARSVAMEFRITDILKGIYNIDRISARSGKAYFFIDTTGHVNYNISVKNKGSGNNEITIDLERINLTDIDAFYNNLSTHLVINGAIKNGRLKSRITGDNIDFTATAQMEIKHFKLNNFIISKSIVAKLDLVLQSSKSGFRFRKGILHIDNYDLGLQGTVSSENILDLNLTGHNLDISRIRGYLPEKFLKIIAEYDPSGVIIVDSKIKGRLTRTSNPHVEINWQLKNGRINYKKSAITFRDLSFAGFFTNGSKNRSETSTVTITDFKSKLGSAEYTGSFALKNFNNPLFDLSLKGRVFPGELKDFFRINDISKADGSVDVELKLVNGLWPKKNFSLNKVFALKPEGTLIFNSFTLGLRNDKILFRKVNGNLLISDLVRANNIQFNYRNQDIKIDGEFRNLPEWLAGKPVLMSATADVSFNRLIPEAFLKTSDGSSVSERNHNAFNLPGDILLDINFTIDSLSYKTFASSKVTGSLNYKPKLLTFKSLKMSALSGMISGNGFIVQNSNKDITSRGNFTVSNIDVFKAFRTFNNFGQTFLKAENIAGSLSGSLSFLLPMDSMMVPRLKSITAEGKYILVNGSLINFDPVKQLSSFIELSELENISFDKLENDFFIRNSMVFIPQMDVKSSAVDLSVNGKHNFNNDYEYHVKMLLSEILSKKRKKTKSNITEFGVVEDDGLSRTSLLLKIVNKGEVFKVGYDIKAASAEVKNNIKKEQQTLKSILNQEYGWYKNDSAVTRKPAEKKSRFRISWDEADSTNNIGDPADIKKDTSAKNIFRKK
jgi:hypothetical protein